MKYSLVKLLLCLTLFAFISCEEDEGGTKFTDTLTVNSYAYNPDDNEFSANGTSVKITSFSFIIQNIGLDMDGKSYDYPSGYEIYHSNEVNRSGLNLEYAIIPEGKYQSMRYSLHKLNSFEIKKIEDLTDDEKKRYKLFKDGSISISISGTVNGSAFTFNSGIEDEIIVKLAEDLVFEHNKDNNIVIYPSAELLFNNNGEVLIPNSSNRTQIEANLKNCFKGESKPVGI